MNLPSCSDTIVPQDVPARLSEVLQPAIDASLPYGGPKRYYLEPFERRYLSRLLEYNGCKVSRVAEKAGLHRSSFQRFLKQHGFDRATTGREGFVYEKVER